jgi:hypothetical protein
MDSSERRPVRILWGSFSDTVLSLVGSREELDSACRRKNIEVIHWCQGKFVENTLHYLFPMRFAPNSETDISGWTSRYQDRFPDLEDMDEVVGYVIDNFTLLCECFQPDIFVSWNKYDPVFGLPHSLAVEKGLATFDLERALVPHLVSFGLEFKPDQADVSEEHVDRGRDLLARYPTAHIRKQRRPHLALPQKRKKLLLVLGSWDAVTDRSVHLYRDSHEMAVRIAEDLADWKVIYKPHPLAPLIDTTHPNLEISAANPISLIGKCDAVVANGTKLELDAIQNGKPLILSGGGFLSNSQAARLASTHESIIDAVRSLEQWHDPEAAATALAAFVGSKAATSWYSVTNEGNEAQPLDALLDRLLASIEVPAEKPDLRSCLLHYHSVSLNRYHRSGIGDIANRDLLAELIKRIKLKLRLSI